MAEGFLPLTPGFATKAIHAGQNPENWNSNAVVPPLELSTTFKQPTPGQPKGFEYSRSGNPTRKVLQDCLASLEGAKYGLTFASGLGALSTIVNLLKAGDHILCVEDLYGGTYSYLTKVASEFGVETSFFSTTDTGKFQSALRPNTKLIWMESPTNPSLRVVDIRNISDIAHKYNKDIMVAIDNTFMTCYFQRPLELGVDIVMYSLTKYMNGHTDIIMGAACTNRDDIYKKLYYYQYVIGAVPSPFDCYMVNRGLKTLSIRMREHMKNGLIVAKFLESHPMVQKVIHPGLPSHPQYELSKKQCSGFSGMVSFYLGVKGGKPADLKESYKFFESLKMVSFSGSLGGYQSLIELPITLSHASVPPEKKEKLGITNNFIRLSVGLEDANDICNDLDQAIRNAFKYFFGIIT